MTLHRRAPSQPGAGDRRLLICDATAAAADLWTIDALVALALEARRRGFQLELRGASADLERLIELCGLGRPSGIAAGGTAVSPQTSAAARRGGTASGH